MNGNGQLGDGSTTEWHSPTAVSSLTALSIVKISAAYWNTYALSSSGQEYSWGTDGYGSLGDGTRSGTNVLSPPVLVSSMGGGVVVGGVSDGGCSAHACAYTVNGAAYCWGDCTQGQVGDGSATTQTSPVGVSGMTGNVTQLGVGMYHSCGVQGGGVLCWGANDHTQLGDGTSTQRNSPVVVSSASSGMSVLEVGFYSACALLSSGVVKCWGDRYAYETLLLLWNPYSTQLTWSLQNQGQILWV